MQPQDQKKWTKRLFSMMKIIVTVGGIAYIFNKVPFFDAISKWNDSTLPWLLFILFLTVILMAIQANRWRGLLLDDPVCGVRRAGPVVRVVQIAAGCRLELGR